MRVCRPENMAVVAVGDFSDVEAVVSALRRHFDIASLADSTPPVPIPRRGLACQLVCMHIAGTMKLGK